MRLRKRVLAVLLTAALAITPIAPLPVMGAGSELAISNLRVENLSEPLGVDKETPAFRWLLSSEEYGRSQSAYRIIVSSTEEKARSLEGDMWDSGKQEGDNNYDIVYGGAPLASRTKYYWTVQVWDENDSPSDFSTVAEFETGIIDPDEWRGDWIGVTTSKMDFEGANWIWKKDNDDTDFSRLPQETQYFRKKFQTDANKSISNVYIGITADDEYVLYVNGEEAGENGGEDSWKNGILYDVTGYVVQGGENTIAVDVYNTSVGYAGLLSKIEVQYSDGTVDTYATDTSWKVSRQYQDNWMAPGHDDSGWTVPNQVLQYGQSPWGRGVTPNAENAFAATVLRKEFNLTDDIEQARAYVAGLGFFEMKINGELPDDTVMNTANTQYTRTVLYRAFDVTDMLVKGNNALGIELGNNFYNEDVGVWNWQDSAWKDEPKLRMELVVDYKNGDQVVISTDDTWKGTKDGPITTNSIYYGETYDARKELTGYDQTGYDDSGWGTVQMMDAPAGTLKSQMMEPMRRTYAGAPKEIKKLSNGSYVVYAPEMLAGWLSLKIKDASEGDKVTITYSEKLESDGQVQKLGGPDGVNSGWWPKAYNQQDNYICKGGQEVEIFEPKFSYKGYEYVQIDGYPGELTADDIICYRTSNDMDITGSFESSNDLFNRMHQMMLTTMANNMQGKPTDTPVWEKNGWLGDVNVGLESMTYNYGFAPMMEQFIETMIDCKEDFGKIPIMVPTQGWGADANTNVIVWNSVFILGIDELFHTYGMESLVRNQYDEMREYTLGVIEESSRLGWTWHDGQLADWVSPMGQGDENSRLPYEEGASEGSGIAGTGFLYRVLDIMVEVAEYFGRTEDAQEYRDAMENVYAAFNEKFYDTTEQHYRTLTFGTNDRTKNRTEYRQTSQLVPLAFGLVPEENKEAVLVNLVKDIRDKNYHLDTGCVGSKFILPVLSDNGYADVAYKIANQTSYPSWGYMADRGTSLWEMWEDTARSLGHYFLGTYDEWFYKGIGGIKDGREGYKTFTIEPVFGEEVKWANVSFESVRGSIVSNWKMLDDTNVEVVVNIPVGSEAKIILPGTVDTVLLNGSKVTDAMEGIKAVEAADGKMIITAGSGSYTFRAVPVINTVDKIDLKAAIIKAQGLDQLDYERTAWNTFSAVLSEAIAVRDNISADQEEVNEMTDKLVQAMEELQSYIDQDRINLKEAVNNAEIVNPAAHPLKYVFAYQDALEAAKAGSTDSELTSEEMIRLKDELLTAAGNLDSNRFENLAYRKEVTALSSHEDGYWGWGKALLTDGDRKNKNDDNEYTGYSSNVGDAKRQDHEEWLYVDLGNSQMINTVVIYPATQTPSIANSCYGFPRTFDIQISQDGVNWETVASETDYPVPSYGPIIFLFEESQARYVKIDAKNLNPKVTDYGYYYMQLTELEVYLSKELTEEVEITAVTTPKTQVVYGEKLMQETGGRAVLDRETTVDGSWRAFDSMGNEVDLDQVQNTGDYTVELIFSAPARYTFADSLTVKGDVPAATVEDGGKTLVFTYSVKVVKAQKPTIPDSEIFIPAAAGGAGEVDLFEAVQRYGIVTGYQIGDITAVESYFAQQPAVDENGKVTFTISAGQEVGKITVPVLISFENYETAEALIQITLTDKIPVEITFTAADSVYDKNAYNGLSEIAAFVTESGEAYEGGFEVIYKNGSGEVIETPVNAGTYSVTVSVADIAYAGAATKEFKIQPKQISAAAISKEILTGDAVPSLSNPKAGTDYNVTGLIEGDALQVKMSYLDSDGKEVQPDGKNAGVYTIGIEADAGSNYQVESKKGTLTVTTRTYNIEVVKGKANFEKAAAGTVVTIAADQPEEGYEFKGWTGTESVVFANATAAATTFVMPEEDVTVTAVYEKKDDGQTPGTDDTNEPSQTDDTDDTSNTNASGSGDKDGKGKDGKGSKGKGGKVVSTGDTAPVAILVIIVVAAAALLLFVIIKRRKK